MLPSSDVPAKVPEAFAAGWQIAELFHEPVPHHPPSHEAIPDHLPGVSQLGSYQTIVLHLDQADRALSDLLGADHTLTSGAVAFVRQALNNDPISGDQVRSTVATLHKSALTELTIADFRLGKAYGLGRALAETALLPVFSSEDDKPARYREKFGAGRLGNLYGWLADLKSALPDHSAYAVSWSLRQWAQWAQQASGPALANADPYLRRQGQQWRALLSGERAGQDLLGTIDLVNAAQGLSSRIGRTIGAFVSRYKGIVALTIALMLLVVGGVVAVAAETGNAKILWAGLTALIGVVGGWKGVSASLGKGIRAVEPSLWQSELDSVIANRILVLPIAVSKPTDDLATMGMLVADTQKAAQERLATLSPGQPRPAGARGD